MRQLRLRCRPRCELLPDHFRLVEVDAPTAEAGPLLLRPHFFSVDPYMRTRMQPEGYDYIERWDAGSRLDVVQGGLAAVPGALIGLLAGDNLGKRIVAL